MRIGHKIDANGFLTEDVLENSGIEPDVKAICPDGLYKAKWNGTSWVEWLTQAEIDAIRNAPKPLTEIEQLKAENATLNERLAQTNADAVGFQEFIFASFPELA